MAAIFRDGRKKAQYLAARSNLDRAERVLLSGSTCMSLNQVLDMTTRGTKASLDAAATQIGNLPGASVVRDGNTTLSPPHKALLEELVKVFDHTQATSLASCQLDIASRASVDLASRAIFVAVRDMRRLVLATIVPSQMTSILVKNLMALPVRAGGGLFNEDLITPFQDLSLQEKAQKDLRECCERVVKAAGDSRAPFPAGQHHQGGAKRPAPTPAAAGSAKRQRATGQAQAKSYPNQGDKTGKGKSTWNQGDSVNHNQGDRRRSKKDKKGKKHQHQRDSKKK